MPALSFQPRHVAAVLNGSKPFTMRKPRRDGSCPKVGDPLHLFTNHRRPDMAKFAVARCVMRTTLWFDARGIAKVQHDALAEDAPPVFGRIGWAIVEAGSTDVKVQELALHQLATWDGFSSWSDLVAWHAANGKLDANGHVLRRLFGMGDVVPEPGFDVQQLLVDA